jgi:hypothetical protein
LRNGSKEGKVYLSWTNQLRGDSLAWLLEADNPAVRALALRDLLERPETDADLQGAIKNAHQHDPIAGILANMDSQGYWVQSGAGYNPKYRSTVWSICLLAQLGASIQMDARLKKACAFVLEHTLTSQGQFSATGVPSGTIDCLQGNLCWALHKMGCRDPRLNQAFEWMARSVTGDGIAPSDDKNAATRYYASKCGPQFACGGNYKLPCAWGATKVMLAFGQLKPEMRTPLIKKAIQQGVDFFFSVDPMDAAYPMTKGSKPSRNWWKFGFPVFYITDLLQVAEALAALGYQHDPRLSRTITFIRQKQDDTGRWALEYHYSGKTWGDYGEMSQTNKWITLRALRVLKAVDS